MSVQESTTAFGAALRQFRGARRMSQLDLAMACEVSSRHLSFLESGRAQPSRDMVLALAEGLLLPLNARNALLQAAGFAPVFPASPLDSEVLRPFRVILDEMIARHAPNPALLVDRHWTVLEANATARTLLAALGGGGDEMNLIRMLTRGDAAPVIIANFPEVLAELRARLQVEALDAGGDALFAELLADLEKACARIPMAAPTNTRRPLLPFVMNTPAGQLRFLSAIAHFGTSEDVTIRDLRLELLFPADDATRAAVAAL
ncbi:MAG: transcriptional regulator [Proteobacteria bacterium HN_bin10]|nr:MAG: transcriptional regulator [Proteobacteria bacterium HN_bin10]